MRIMAENSALQQRHSEAVLFAQGCSELSTNRKFNLRDRVVLASASAALPPLGPHSAKGHLLNTQGSTPDCSESRRGLKTATAGSSAQKSLRE